MADAVLLARFIAEDRDAAISDAGKRLADVNRSGQPDTDDITLILKYIALLIDTF